MEQTQQQEEQPEQPAETSGLTFRDVVDITLIFGGIPALVLNVIFWAVATAFAGAGALPTVLALLITLLLALAGVILLVRYVDIAVINFQKANANNNYQDDEFSTGMGAGTVCAFLVICIVGCLSVAGSLEAWHYILMAGEVLLIGYQTWRVFLGRQQ